MGKKTPFKAWGGFIDGKLDDFPVAPHWDFRLPAVFASKEKAQRLYMDVRRVEIREVQ